MKRKKSSILGADFLCGHNIIRHDLSYLRNALQGKRSDLLPGNHKVIDTLFWSPLMFPQRPYPKLVKDDKLQTGELNNPLNDAIKARDLFYDEDAAFRALPHPLKRIYYALLRAADGYAAGEDSITPRWVEFSTSQRRGQKNSLCGNDPRP